MEVLRWPGVLATDALPPETLQAAALELIDNALNDFIANRAREGEKLAGLLQDRAAAMEVLVAEIRPKMPQIVADYEAKLTQRFVEALGAHDDERIRQEIVLFIMGGVFVMEALSVMIQVGSFKLTGKRVFRMAPLHHHYELKGWKETQVVVRFWIITMMLVLAGLSTLKLR